MSRPAIALLSLLACDAACTFSGLDAYTAGLDGASADASTSDTREGLDAQSALDARSGDSAVSADGSLVGDTGSHPDGSSLSEASPGDTAPPKDAIAPTDSPAMSHDAGHDAATAPCDLAQPFGAPTLVTELDTTSPNEGATLSPDELTIFFMSSRLGAGSNVFQASRATTQDSFSSIGPLSSLNFAGYDTWNVTITGDGTTAFFVTHQGNVDHMYSAVRGTATGSFGPETLMPGSVGVGEQPYVIPDGTALYYTDQRGTPYSIARAALSGVTVTSKGGVALAVAGMDVGLPVVNPTETLIYFGVFTHTNMDSFDIWTASRATSSDPWGAPSAVAELNTSTFDAASWISADGCELYMSHATTMGANWEILVARKP